MAPLEDVVRIGRALSDRTRVRLLAALAVRDLCVCELTALVAAGQPAVSRHLGILRSAGLVEDVRDGKWVNYRLAPDPGPVAADLLRSLAAAAGDDPELRDLAARARVVDRADLVQVLPPPSAR